VAVTVTSTVSFAASPSPSQSISSSHEAVQIVPPGSKLSGLTAVELRLLREKQARLASTAPSTLASLPLTHSRNALEASLIFAQYEAGSAVCIDPAGWLLTCAHCFGDTEEEWKASDRRKWLLFYTGLAVQVQCQVWDSKRDLALLKIIAVESSRGNDGAIPTFRFVPLSALAPGPNQNTPIFCIGQPGRDDLESTSDRKTLYHLIEVSHGKFRGMVPGDPHDNSEIGALKHDAWTYWGHSGAPLLRESDGTLIGLHSSWDDTTTMRHGVAHVAIEHFLRQHLPRRIGQSTLQDTAVERRGESADLMFEIGAASGPLTGRKGKEVAARGTSNSRPIIVIDDDDEPETVDLTNEI
jgi:Trypsin-like peptidase domain